MRIFLLSIIVTGRMYVKMFFQKLPDILLQFFPIQLPVKCVVSAFSISLISITYNGLCYWFIFLNIYPRHHFLKIIVKAVKIASLQ